MSLPLAPEKPKQDAANLAVELWIKLGLYGRIAVLLLVAVAVTWLVVLGLRRLSGARLRSLLWGLTISCAVAVIGLGSWAASLPEPRGTYFVLWHQIVRVGAALSGTGFIVGFMGLATRKVLDLIEGRSFVQLVAARHVRSSKSGFLTAISILSILGVGVSSFALCAVVSIMGGFGADLKRKILGNNAHIKIEAKSVGGFDNWRSMLDEVRLVPGVKAATQVAGGEAMASSRTNTAGVLVKGIDTETIGTVIDLISNIEVGKFEYLNDPAKLARLPPDAVIGRGPGGEVYFQGPDFRSWEGEKSSKKTKKSKKKKPRSKKGEPKPRASSASSAAPGTAPPEEPARTEPAQAVDDLDPEVKEAIVPPDAYPGIVIGRELAKSLHVYVGEEVTLVTPLGDLGPMGVMPRSRRFRVAAIFYSGMYEYDASHAYMKLEEAQELLNIGHNVTGIEIKVDNAENVSAVAQPVKAAIGRDDLVVKDWKELNKNLFSALKLEKIATFIILSIAIAVASFCIICTLLLMVTEKSKEIAIMKAIGASDRAILRIFMTEGVLIGGIGTVFGVSTGLAATLGLLWFGVRLDPDVYYVDRLPISVDPVDYSLVALSAMVITTLATLYPAMAASRLRPVEGIRYE